ncbi:MAG: GTP 3',8-cyclase MoaA [Elusimicrobia bacterium]|nr:GTP 3',8-cyclase MoaA [Elusimicrobiota bacterium]
MPALIDPSGRRIDYLRLSVTDQCNLRCSYCRPSGDGGPLPPAPLLSDHEVVAAVRAAIAAGITKVRVTGGEPLLRPGLPGLLRRLSALPGLADLSLTTNGLLLAGMARDLKGSGLNRVNVSLDTLVPERFREVAGGGHPKAVLEGVAAALAEGLSPVKINVVVMVGVNDSEIPGFVLLARDMPVHVRFIELMPVGEAGASSMRRRVPFDRVRELCGPLESVLAGEEPRGFGPAEYFRSPGAAGTVGFISALSRGFCGRCNRLRLTSQGRLLSCLAGEAGLDLAPLLRAPGRAGELGEAFRKGAAMKPDRHRMEEGGCKPRPAVMCSVGG